MASSSDDEELREAVSYRPDELDTENCHKCGASVPKRAIAEHVRECCGLDEDQVSSSSSRHSPLHMLLSDAGSERGEESAASSGDEHGADDANAYPDPGLLNENERLGALFRWCKLNRKLDPRQRFGSLEWAQIQTIVEARMSVDMTAKHLARLHEHGLCLSIRSRKDVFMKLRSLLDDDPALMVGSCTARMD